MYYTTIKEIPLYEFCLLEIILTDDEKKIKDRFDVKIEQVQAFVQQTTVGWKGMDDRRCLTLVINSSTVPEGKLQGLIAHEVIHIKNRLWKAMKSKLSLKYDEPEAYLVEWLVNTINEFLKDKIQ